jgi:WD40 repeat protein
LVKKLDANQEEGFGLAFSPHKDTQLATTGYDGKTFIFDIDSETKTEFNLST